MSNRVKSVKKSTVSTAIYALSPVIVVFSIIGLITVFAPEISAFTNSLTTQKDLKPLPESLELHVQGVTKNNDFYNVSLSVTNVGPSIAQIDKVQAVKSNAIPYENITDAGVYYDGAQAHGGANIIKYDLGCNGTLQVNFIIPTTEYIPGTTAVIVYTPQFLYYSMAEVS